MRYGDCRQSRVSVVVDQTEVEGHDGDEHGEKNSGNEEKVLGSNGVGTRGETPLPAPGEFERKKYIKRDEC